MVVPSSIAAAAGFVIRRPQRSAKLWLFVNCPPLYYDSVPMDTRRRTYAILIGIILLTIPCYVSGIALLARAPNRGEATPTAEAPTCLLYTSRCV